MSGRFRPRPARHLRYEAYSLASILAIPVALALSFPRSAVAFSAAEGALPGEATCAFATLSEDDEREALAAARAAWKVSAEDVRSVRLDLSIDSVPEDAATSVSTIAERGRIAPAASVSLDEPALPPTLAAPPPAQIAADPGSGEDGVAFSRDELLRID